MLALCTNPDIDYEKMKLYPRYGLSMKPVDKQGDLQVVYIEMDVVPPVGFNGFFWPRNITIGAVLVPLFPT